MSEWIPQWFIDGVLFVVLAGLFLVLYAFANKMLSKELNHLVSIVKSEMEDSKARRFSVGSINWRGFIALFIFGIITIIFTSGQKLIGLVGSIVGVAAAGQLVASTNFLSMFFFLSIWLLVSVIVVVIDKRGRARTS